MPRPVRQAMLDAARRLGESVAYRSAGTVEYIYDPQTEAFYFLEVNTTPAGRARRHPRRSTGIDLVE